jgi:GntR family transcriptional regulator
MPIMELQSETNAGYVPLYRQIKRLITDALRSGEWAPGQSIPSEFELAQRYNVSQGTVRKAISDLATQKLVVRHQGRGTFVASHQIEPTKFPFLRLAPDVGPVVDVNANLIDFWRIKLDELSASNLSVAAGSTGWLIRRILAPEGVQTIYEEIRLPGQPFEVIEEKMLLDHNCMLYSMYEAVFGLRILHVEERVKAVLGEGEIVDRLGLLDGSPLLRVDRIAYTYGDRPVELRRSYCNTSNHHYRNQIV